MYEENFAILFILGSPACRAVLMCVAALELDVSFKKANSANEGEDPQMKWTIRVNNRAAKCQFFTQIISVQLNLPQEKARQLREVFDI